MFFVSSAIIIFAYGRTLKRYAYWPLFAAFVLFAKFFLMSFVYVRQEVAMAVLCFSIPAIVRRQPVRFALFMLVAFSFHKSALIFAPVYFVGYRRFTNVQIVYLSILFLVLALSPLGSAIQSLAAENIDDGKVNAYLQLSGGLNLFYVAEAVLILGLAMALRKRFYGYKETTLFFNGMFMYAVIVLMSAANATFVRFSWYYLIFLALALSYTVVFLRPARRLLFNGIAVVYFSALFLRLMLLFDDGDFMPYKSIFQDFDRKGRWEFMEYRR
ncbi:MAG: EpsG family protein [Chryseobacterium sp.]|nr:MAG: EpsG family protein [Chryseobacterium sp.]